MQQQEGSLSSEPQKQLKSEELWDRNIHIEVVLL